MSGLYSLSAKTKLSPTYTSTPGAPCAACAALITLKCANPPLGHIKLSL